MSELKFVCPSCGQLMQCEKAYVGHEIPCPTCGAALRIPCSDGPGGSPAAPPRAQLVLSATAEASHSGLGETFPNGANEASAASEIPKQIVVNRESEIKKMPRLTDTVGAGHCVCPVCQSELRVPAEATGDGAPKLAELIRKGPPTNSERPASGGDSTASHAHGSPLSPIERERQIAAARAAHPIELYPTVKPRLSYILSGGQRPSEGEPEKESPPAAGAKETGDASRADGQTFSE